MPDRPADRIRKLVTLGASGDTPEAATARRKAQEALANLDDELLNTLAVQRKRLLEALGEEDHRLISAKQRATKRETGELVSRARALLGHYERLDALMAAVMLARLEIGRPLTTAQRQRLDGPDDRGWLF